MTIRRAAVALLVAGLALGSLPAVAADESVTISETLDPARLRIDAGTTVTWLNRDDERHRVRSKDGPVRFDSKNLERGESYAFTFTVPGEYPYYDHRNRDDQAYFGTIVVEDASEPAAATEAGEVVIVDDAFAPTQVSVVAGGSVTWVNRGADEHTVSANDLAFDSGSVASGATFTRAFETAGEYPYFCQIHPEMRGTVVVVEADPNEADAAPLARTEIEPASPEETESRSAPAAEAEVVDSPSIGSALDLLASPAPDEAP